MVEIPILRQQEGRCPHARSKCVDCLDICDLNDKTCLLETGETCEEWEDIKKEWAEEDKK